ALLLAALVAIERQVEQVLLAASEQIVQSIDFGSGVRDSSASAHDAMEVVVMLRVEETEQGHDRVPRVGAPRLDEEAADLAISSVAQTAIRRHLYSVQRRIRRYRRAIEDADVLCQRGDNQIDVEADEFLYRDRRAEFHQHFEPQAEAPGVQLFVEA